MGTDGGAVMRLLLYLAVAHLAFAGEADYTLDDSFWNEESPVGEVERLLREFRQNQELVRNIGAHYYQIIYPVQLRHHEKMGISTREVGAQKFPGGRGYGSGADGSYQSSTRARTRTGKHFHRTSLLIKAFNHKFRLDLELNTQLLAPNLVQKHFLPSGAEQMSKQEIEHCYYHGTVKDYPGASAAFHTCNGVSGVIHVGNETFVIHPFYGGDLSKHPHVIFEARSKTNKGCANSGTLERRVKNLRRTKHISNAAEEPPASHQHRYKRWTPPFIKELLPMRSRRDVREATKYIETALVIDKAMFDKRNGSTRAEVVHDAIQVANIADLYFRTLNTRVSLVYIETWQGSNQAQIDKGQDISRALLNFNDYTSRKLFKIDKDTTQLLTGETFSGGESGMAVPDTVCTPKSVGISVDINTYEPHLLAGTMAHMIGHNIGMGHDDNREECFCRDWHGCIMAQSIVGLENVQPYKFSECSKNDYIDALRTGQGICLLNKPNELEVRRSCGNGVVEDGEDCDCGTIDECHEKDPCCDPITCKLTKEAQCASGECCHNCQLRSSSVVCREAGSECDLPERCTGESGACPPDVYKKNGQPCGQHTGYCFNGVCPTLTLQCEQIWGYGGVAADKQCFDQFNSKGSINGHCGMDAVTQQYIKCEAENVKCGTLQCQSGNRYPAIAGMDDYFTRTIISIKGIEFECKSTSGVVGHSDLPKHGLVRDGTPCGDSLVCVNQTCTSLFPYVDQSKCPSNHNNVECSGHGICSNVNRCHCEPGWAGPDCSIPQEITVAPPTQWDQVTTPAGEKPKSNLDLKMEKKETPYENYHGSNTVFLVGMLMSVVGGVFITFALMALCYRKSSKLRNEPPYIKKPIAKSFPGGSTGSNHSQEDVSMDGSKMHSFTNMPSSFSRGDSTRVLFRHGNHMNTGPNASRYPEHKMQQMKRMGVGSGSEEDPTHSGEEDTVAFIDVPPNKMSKLPEKGILKKHGGSYGVVMSDSKEKWGDDSQSDNLEIMSQSDSNMGPELLGGAGTITDVERTLKSLNGYHEDILEALRNAASHRGSNATPSGSSSLLSEDILRKTLQDCGGSYEYKRSSSQEKICDGMPQTHTVMVEGGTMHHRHGHEDDEDDDVPPSCGPIRIRNLEDLIRQLEHHSSRHMSPSGSEDIRMSEAEADRHYRMDNSAACSESSQGSRCRSRGPEESGFTYGRYRHPSQRGPSVSHGSHSVHGSTGHVAQHAPYPPHHALRAPSPHRNASHRVPPPPDDEALYETADRERTSDPHRLRDPQDSESDEFIQAQQQLARWASEDALPAGAEAGSAGSAAGAGGAASASAISALSAPRDYYPSPPSSSSGRDEPVTVVSPGPASNRRPPSDSDDTAPSSSLSGAEAPPPARFPEYKH